MDVKTTITDAGFDVVIEGGDLVLEDSPITPVLVSIFSDRRREDSDPIFDERDLDRRGWWADSEADRFGSGLWLYLWRTTLTLRNIEKIRETLLNSLLWMVEDGFAARVEVQAERVGVDRLSICIILERGQSTLWPEAWDDLDARLAEFASVTTRILTVR